MDDNILSLPEPVVRFVEARKEQGSLSAVILYGSYARGTQHEQSDVDIIFIVDEGFKSLGVISDSLCFEVLETTKNNMVEYWQKNLDEDRHRYLWKDAKVIYDRDAEGAEIVEHANGLVGERSPWTSEKSDNNKLIMLERASSSGDGNTVK